MNVVIWLFCFTVIVYGKLPKDVSQSIRETMIRSGLECIDEVGASEDDIVPLLRYTLPETEKGKCFVACMHKKFQIMQKDGKIDKVSLIRMLEELKSLDIETYKLIKPVADKCFAEAKVFDDECETATNLLKCWYQEGNCGPTSTKCIFEFE